MRSCAELLACGDVGLVPSGGSETDWAERSSSEELARLRIQELIRPNQGSGIDPTEANSGDLAERVNSGTNPDDLAERATSGTNPGDLAERVNSGTNPVGMTSSDSSSSVVVVSSSRSGRLVGVIPRSVPQERFRGPHRMDLDELRGMPKVSSGKAPPTHAATREVGSSPATEAPNASSKRPVDVPVEQAADAAKQHKKIKVLTRRHKPSDGGPKAVAKAEGCASELQEDLEKTRRERDEELRRHEASEKELHEALDSPRAELPRQTVVQYKESLDFKEGLKRMGWVTYEYVYRVVLTRFHARHPNAKVEEAPFTMYPEDDLVPMERQQAFDDSVPPEP
ncbi:hypothetical protein BHE74_00016850 [Ensete ventricosum]|nr:hypothetical protein BHE74_00016850 [Ensete ventricosum]